MGDGIVLPAARQLDLMAATRHDALRWRRRVVDREVLEQIAEEHGLLAPHRAARAAGVRGVG